MASAFGRPMTLHERMGAASHARSLYPSDPTVVLSEKDFWESKTLDATVAPLLRRAKLAALRGDQSGMSDALDDADALKPLAYGVRREIEASLLRTRTRASTLHSGRWRHGRRPSRNRKRLRHRNGQFKKLRRTKKRRSRNPLPRWVDRRSIRTIFRGKGKKSRRILVGCPKGSWSPKRKRCKKGMRLVEKKRR